MKNRYNQIMEKIKVTPEMSERILNNISKIDIQFQSPKTTYYKKYKKIISIAACFVVLLVATIVVPQIINPSIEPPIQEIPDIKICKSVRELSSELGFEVYEPNYIPFDVMQRTYTVYWKEVAEINYSNENNNVIFRMAQGSEDVSGDYSEYNDVKECQTDFGKVTLKGNDEAYSLAIWWNSDMSYSIQTIKPLSKDLMLAIVLSVKKLDSDNIN